MQIDFVRSFCLSLPHTTEQVQWGAHLVFKIDGRKMYAIGALEPSKYILSLKVAPETFDELIERGGMAQAPYCAKRQWIALEPEHPLSASELAGLLRSAYDLIFANLPKKVQAQLSATPAAKGGAGKTLAAAKKAGVKTKEVARAAKAGVKMKGVATAAAAAAPKMGRSKPRPQTSSRKSSTRRRDRG
jgi:predicted DNA-binding protein (MmcQ/YjbR family)